MNTAKTTSKFTDFQAEDIRGQTISLSQYAGQVILVVNVASRCGFTKQYSALETLQRRYSHQGFVVLGFPCNQFGSQEPGQNDEILSFCETSFGVTFPLFAKIEVNGAATHPLYTWLKESATGFLGTKSIKWNFTKFLIDRTGCVVKRYAPLTAPEALEVDIVQALAQPVPN